MKEINSHFCLIQMSLMKTKYSVLTKVPSTHIYTPLLFSSLSSSTGSTHKSSIDNPLMSAGGVHQIYSFYIKHKLHKEDQMQRSITTGSHRRWIWFYIAREGNSRFKEEKKELAK